MFWDELDHRGRQSSQQCSCTGTTSKLLENHSRWRPHEVDWENSNCCKRRQLWRIMLMSSVWNYNIGNKKNLWMRRCVQTFDCCIPHSWSNVSFRRSSHFQFSVQFITWHSSPQEKWSSLNTVLTLSPYRKEKVSELMVNYSFLWKHWERSL